MHLSVSEDRSSNLALVSNRHSSIWFKNWGWWVRV